MRRHPLSSILFAAAAALATSTTAKAQEGKRVTIPLLSGERDDHARLAQLAGWDSSYLILRGPSRLTLAPAGIAVVSPDLTAGANTALTWGLNDGPLWQGRGANLILTAGVTGSWGPVRLILAPQYTHAQNGAYQVVPYPQSGSDRSVWANPFHPAPFGIDLPLRQGDAPLNRIDAGQSSLTWRGRILEAGLSTENAWWGPGMLNALVLGAAGPGVPSAFVRTAAPRRTRAGTFDAWLTVGQLAESPWFDRNPKNDARSLGGFALNWRPPGTNAVDLGIARVVIAAGNPSLATAFDPFRSVGRPNGPDSLSPGNRDQVTSLWARWALPAAGFEAWTEWARFEEPASLRDLLEMPGHSQGYTLGLQWLRPVGRARVRLWAEASYLEPSPSLRLRPVGATYVSRSVPQGFTNRGQPLAAAIGPGGSSQWVSGDWLRDRWRLGGFLGRIRWDNAAVFTPVVPEIKREDISLAGGLRAAGEWYGVRVLAEWAHSVRLNYLFQAYQSDDFSGRTHGIDVVNDAINLTFSAPLGPSR